ncbi:hypothetical protein SmJEL517_g00764 [Synchytrium microbalum]|uniref:Uncharacterized protein n=1 Tax=Synchytrium microbalum TaxID=1806994 RepID=A0A507CD84_9FUNG|nr:uncharacterized protein SmJEL517_g00764 [Synchytrium microbalum]TPX37461.1 hypothetical protein SmJEL517_g00764 [Synchytrium microbalum]
MSCGCGNDEDATAWQREPIPEHKFDGIDVESYASPQLVAKISYSGVFLLTLKSVLVYMADIGIVAILLINGAFSQAVANTSGCTAAGNVCIPGGVTTNYIPFYVRPWLMAGSIIVSFALLFLDYRRARIVLRSRDIAYAFTNTIAYRFYTLRSYPHFCFFSTILFAQLDNNKKAVAQASNAQKRTDVLAFFVFFGLKGWKRLVLAEFPRVLLNGMNIYDAMVSNMPKREANLFIAYGSALSSIVAKYPYIVTATLILATFTVSIWIVSFGRLVISGVSYIPLACIIRGNLKEYVCKRIDKRIEEMLRRKKKKQHPKVEEIRDSYLTEGDANSRPDSWEEKQAYAYANGYGYGYDQGYDPYAYDPYGQYDPNVKYPPETVAPPDAYMGYGGNDQNGYPVTTMGVSQDPYLTHVSNSSKGQYATNVSNGSKASKSQQQQYQYPAVPANVYSPYGDPYSEPSGSAIVTSTSDYDGYYATSDNHEIPPLSIASTSAGATTYPMQHMRAQYSMATGQDDEMGARDSIFTALQPEDEWSSPTPTAGQYDDTYYQQAADDGDTPYNSYQTQQQQTSYNQTQYQAPYEESAYQQQQQQSGYGRGADGNYNTRQPVAGSLKSSSSSGQRVKNPSLAHTPARSRS